MIVNLLREALSFLKEKGKSFDDVKMICGYNCQITKEQFLELADFEYDDESIEPGHDFVADDLMLVGDDFWIERHNGAHGQWWEFKQHPFVDGQKRPFRTDIRTLVSMHPLEMTIEDMNEED